MWHDLLAAIALVLVIEGMFPFLNPARFKRHLAMMLQMEERTLRNIGLGSMVAGIILLYVVR
ncbi:MAG: DUF2065 domain-containing protein [Gammaproteobacteria bacterium]